MRMILRSLVLTVLLVASLSGGETGEVRSIKLVQDDAQIKFVSKLYELKHVRATDVLPFVNSAILRYHANSKIQRVNFGDAESNALLISTGEEFMPYVDKLIAEIDAPRPVNADGSTIEGTGVTRIAYEPKYRSARQFETILRQLVSSDEGRVYVNADNNTIFWQDADSSARETLRWIERLDRPLPQVAIRFNYYEVRSSTLRDIGFDYLAWKNGPGVNLFQAGYNAGHLVIDEAFQSIMTQAPIALDIVKSWGVGGFFTAPQFDMSFIRILQQSGNANLVANATLTMVNTPVSTRSELARLRWYQRKYPDKAPFQYRVSMQPEYQNIAKNAEGRAFIGADFIETVEGKVKDPPDLTVRVVNPIICFPSGGVATDADGFVPSGPELYGAAGDSPGGGCVIFNYSALFKNVVERSGSTGSELSNSTSVNGGVTLGFKVEKVLACYEKNTEVEQTIGLPVVSKIPLLKYLFSTTTTIRANNYIVLTAEAELVDPGRKSAPIPTSRSSEIGPRRGSKVVYEVE